MLNPFVALLRLGLACCLLAAVSAVVHAALPSPMIGRQSNNTGIRAVPAPGPVKIDGDLSDWDLSGRIWSFADIAIRDRYSAETAVMWDKDAVYLAVHFKDPNPMHNTINPVFDPESGWKGDALQLRMLTDWPQWLTMWQFSGEKRSMLHHAMWKDPTADRKGVDVTLHVGEPGATKLDHGIEMAFKADADGHGYVQEVRLPWAILYKQAPTVAPGLTFRMGMEFFYGAEGATDWPVHRYADNLQPGETSREFFWNATKLWGDVKLVGENNIEQLTYIPDVGKLEGTIAVRATIPAKAKEFTVVIETADGKRVRNLGAQLNPDQYSVSVKGDERVVEMLWDGTDDDGKIVPAGTYKVRGLSHQGLGADYVMSFFNPGTPPWEAGKKGSWGADHGAPEFAAAAGEWALLGWHFAEGGHGIVAVGPDGLKKWGEKRGVQSLAANTDNVFFISSSWSAAGNLCRLNLKDGAYKPFVLDGKERPFELTPAEIFGSADAVPGQIVTMGASGDTLALAMSDGKIALLDTNSAALKKLLTVPAPTAVAFGPKGELYAVSDGKLVEVNIATGALRAIATPGLVDGMKVTANDNFAPEVAATSKSKPVKAGTLAVDPQGNLGLYDNGPDQQVKFYTPSGKFEYAVGKKGGRPIRGNFDEQAMRHVSSVAVDAKGQTWVTEDWEYPRRVSVWGRDGKLVRDYVGNTGYAGTGAFLHDQEPSLAYYGPVEMKLDMVNHTWKVQRVLWVPGEGELFAVPTRSHTHPHRFYSDASGKRHEYMFSPPYRPNDAYVVYMEDAKGDWRPVSAMGTIGQLSGKLDEKSGMMVEPPSGDYAGLSAYDGYFWNDANADGKVQFSEVTVVPSTDKPAKGKRGAPGIPLGSGWGTRMSKDDLSFYVNGVTKYTPLKFTADGAPVFGPASIKKLSFVTKASGDYVPVASENAVIALMWENNFGTKGLYALDATTGEPRWSYPNPFPGVHGSHRAPMPQPGLLIGPLKILGVADMPNNNGHVFGLRGNLGQDYYFTTDGLLIGTVFQDGRLPTQDLPSKESALFGAPMESYSGGGEPFTGWFGGHDDGKVRLISGMPRQAAMILEMTGLADVRRFTAPSLAVTAKQLGEAAIANDARTAANAKKDERRATIAKLAAAPAIDGKGTGWKDVPTFDIASPASSFKAKAQLAYDATTLYVALDVEDPSPWVNEGIDFSRLFKTGDAVDLQFGTGAKTGGEQPAAGDLRVVLSQLGGKPAAVLMQAVNPTAAAGAAKVYTSPVGAKKFAEVRLLDGVKIAVVKKARSYRLEAAVPLASIGLKPQAGADVRGDIGFISSDAAGRINTARAYWANPSTNLVNDEPFEAWYVPSAWGTFTWGK